MSSFNASRIRLRVFDFHLSLPALLGTAKLRSGLEFLVKSGQYGPSQEQLCSPSAAETEHLLLRPLRPSELSLGPKFTRNKFWAHYFDEYALPPGQLRRWIRQIPLRAIPKDFEVKLISEDPRVKGQVRTNVWLWPFGWSSHLELVLDGELSLVELRKLVSGVENLSIFRLGGEPFTLAGLFSRLAGRVRKDLYGSATIGKQHPLIPRHVLVSIEKVSSLPARWVEGTDYDAFYDGDRALLHAALLGTEIDASEVIRREEAGEFTLSILPPAGFGITYFRDQGGRTLLVLPSEGPEEVRRSGCLAGNISLCSMMAFSLTAFVTAAEQTDSVEVADLVKTAKSALLGMPGRYPNPFCLSLFENHKRLRAWRQAV